MKCPLLSNDDWVAMVTRRGIGKCAQWPGGSYSSGIWRKKAEIRPGSLSSRLLRDARRLAAWSANVNDYRRPRRYRNTLIPVFSDYEDFNKFRGLRGDRPFTLAPAPIEAAIRGKKRPCGSFYTLNLRTPAMTHLRLSGNLEGGMKKRRARHARAQTPGAARPCARGHSKE